MSASILPNNDPENGNGPSGEVRVRSTSSSTLRITPPQEVRRAVGMEEDEPWTWFYDPHLGDIYLRRPHLALEGVADYFLALGVSRPVQNGRYMDFSIPPLVVDEADLNAGTAFHVYAVDYNTVQFVPKVRHS